MTELVTAVIPTYNYARFVGRAVTSVLDQSYPSIECIVVDDGSTDETREVLGRFGDRIRAIHQQNRGLSAARNRGIAEARGAYVAFLDADDWWLKPKIEEQVRWMQAHPSVGCVGCGREHIDSDGSRTTFPGLRNHRTREETLRDLGVRTFWVGGSGSGAMIRSALLQTTGGFDERLTAAEDWDMWLRLAAVTGIDNVPAVLTTISRHGTGVFRNVQRMEQNQRLVYDKIIEAWPDAFSRVDRRKMRALILADAAGECMAMGDRKRAMSYVSRSLREWPFNARRLKMAAALGVRRG